MRKLVQCRLHPRWKDFGVEAKSSSKQIFWLVVFDLSALRKIYLDAISQGVLQNDPKIWNTRVRNVLFLLFFYFYLLYIYL